MVSSCLSFVEEVCAKGVSNVRESRPVRGLTQDLVRFIMECIVQ